jgi:hypothetical protein
MVIFGSGMSTGPSAYESAREAAAQACRVFGNERPKVAIVFASMSFADAHTAPQAIRETVGDIAIVGGSAGGCVIGPHGVGPLGVSVILLGGADIEVDTRVARVGGPELVDVVPAAREIARAADQAARNGLEHYTCLVFAPALHVDGEALVAAVRKGAGARAQLAGGLTGDDLTLDRTAVFVGDELRDDHVVLAGVFTRKSVGIAARHGCRPVGARRIVTRAEANILYELDNRPALQMWLDDARAAGARVPDGAKDIAFYLASHYGLGFADRAPKNSGESELIMRAPFQLVDGGGIQLSGSIDEGRRVRVMQTSRKDLLRASTNAAADAVMRARTRVAGAVVLACSGRLAALGEEFTEEPALVQNRVAAPIGGACVFGEIAKMDRELDAFFNATTVVVAFAS